jgi:hypothetical protein
VATEGQCLGLAPSRDSGDVLPVLLRAHSLAGAFARRAASRQVGHPGSPAPASWTHAQVMALEMRQTDSRQPPCPAL